MQEIETETRFERSDRERNHWSRADDSLCVPRGWSGSRAILDSNLNFFFFFTFLLGDLDPRARAQRSASESIEDRTAPDRKHAPTTTTTARQGDCESTAGYQWRKRAGIKEKSRVRPLVSRLITRFGREVSFTFCLFKISRWNWEKIGKKNWQFDKLSVLCLPFCFYAVRYSFAVNKTQDGNTIAS